MNSYKYFNMRSLIYAYTHTEVAQSCPTLCDPMDCSPPGSSVHEIFQARVLEWVAISFSSLTQGLRISNKLQVDAEALGE